MVCRHELQETHPGLRFEVFSHTLETTCNFDLVIDFSQFLAVYLWSCRKSSDIDPELRDSFKNVTLVLKYFK